MNANQLHTFPDHIKNAGICSNSVALAVMLLIAIASGTVRGGNITETNQMHIEAADPYLWLEDIHGSNAMDWVKTQNAKSAAVLEGDADYRKDYDAILKVMDATDRIPSGNLNHNFVFNFWQDAQHPRGICRRTTIADYSNAQPQWETLLDVDKLAVDEKENWVWKGTNGFELGSKI